MLLSKSCVYGIRAVLYMAVKESNGFVPIREISERLEISFHFLTKILQQLTVLHLLESYKGPNGGIKLARPSSEIKLRDIVAAIDGEQILTECILGLPGCGHETPCPMHNRWADVRNSIEAILSKTTLEDLISKRKNGTLRIDSKGNVEWD